MKATFVVKPSNECREHMNILLDGYWGNDVWDIRDPFFDDYRPEKWSIFYKTIDFSMLTLPIQNELKYMLASRLIERSIRLLTVIQYGTTLRKFAEFLRTCYSRIQSIVEIPYEKGLMQWRSYLVKKGYKVSAEGRLSNGYFEAVYNQLHSFYTDFYDNRDEYEKDRWDCRKIPGAKITENKADYFLDFSDIPVVFRSIVKRYIKFRTTKCSQSQCVSDTRALRLFTKFIHEKEPAWVDFTSLSRVHMEEYLVWYRKYTDGWKKQHVDYMVSLRLFLDYIQRAQYPEAPTTPSVLLLFKEDIPKLPIKADEDILLIPEGVLQQLDDNIELLPAEYIHIVVLLRASGWRISDIMNLRYDKCLSKDVNSWYLCGDIPKTQVLNHKIPITDEIASIAQAAIELAEAKSTNDNNPNHLLFFREDGKRKGRCPQGKTIRYALNSLAHSKGIVDDQGNIFHFGNHAFRHTKGVELINNGMNILFVQKWMAHASPEMTLRYARIFDSTMRKEWDETVKNGIFRTDETGKIRRYDLSEFHDEKSIEWEYIRSNLDAVRMPLGFCMKPSKQECYTQLAPCLTCRNFCMTPDSLPEIEKEIQKTQQIIEQGKILGRSVWVEKNTIMLGKLEQAAAVLCEGKIRHLAGKKGREYVEE